MVSGNQYFLYNGNELERGFPKPLTNLGIQSNWRKLMESWCADITGEHISSVEPCIESKEHYMLSCVHLIVGGFELVQLIFFAH